MAAAASLTTHGSYGHLAASAARWAPTAGLLIGNLAHRLVEDTDWDYSEFSMYDLGQAVAHMSVQAQSLGLHVRQFRALDRAALAAEFDVPPHWEVTTMSAIGRVAPDTEAAAPAEGPQSVGHRRTLPENVLISIVIDVRDAETVAGFWAEVLGCRIVERGESGISIGIEDGPCEIDFRTVPDAPKTEKNRVHLDITPTRRDLAAEHDRLLSLGAREQDVGQGERRWYVLADAEGNEFCLCPVPKRSIVSAADLPAGESHSR